jgi:hypothetical protein
LLREAGRRDEALKLIDEALLLLRGTAQEKSESSLLNLNLRMDQCLLLAETREHERALSGVQAIFEKEFYMVPLDNRIKFLKVLSPLLKDGRNADSWRRLQNRLERDILLAMLSADPNKPVEKLAEFLEDLRQGRQVPIEQALKSFPSDTADGDGGPDAGWMRKWP